MAVVYESTGAGAWATADNPVATKPTGLAVGDLMIVFIGAISGARNFSLTNWTSIFNRTSGTTSLTALWKIATSGDVAAADFTFTADGASGAAIARIIRFSGTHQTTPIGDFGSNVFSGADPKIWDADVDPVANSMLVMAVMVIGSLVDVDGYAIPTSDPGWNEKINDGTALSSDGTLAVATSNTRSASTNTGDPQANTAAQNLGTIGGLISITPGTSDYPITADFGSFTLTGQAAVLTSARAIIAALGTYTLTGFDALFARGKSLVADFGSFVLTGQDSAFAIARTMVAAVGTFTLTGYDMAFQIARMLAAAVGNFVLTGYAVRFLKNGTSVVLINKSKTSTTLTKSNKHSSSLTNQNKS